LYRDGLYESPTDGFGWWVFFRAAGPHADDTVNAPERVG
jgi:hypothetical protein